MTEHPQANLLEKTFEATLRSTPEKVSMDNISQKEKQNRPNVANPLTNVTFLFLLRADN